MKGNFHARFLGGKEAVKSLTYPTIGKMRRAVPSMGRILKEWLWRFREIRGLMLVMKNSALSSVEEKIYDFVYKDLSIKDFEEWLYISNELESLC